MRAVLTGRVMCFMPSGATRNNPWREARSHPIRIAKAVRIVSPRNMAFSAGRDGGIWKPWGKSSACHHVEQVFHRDHGGRCAGCEINYSAPRFCYLHRMPKRVTVLCLAMAFTLRAGDRPGTWTGPYAPCDGHAEVLKREPMSLGVRFATSDPKLTAEFARAMTFWAGILDMNWHEEDSRACAIQVVDGDPGLFGPAEVARAQFPGTPEFQGWIAFNPKTSLPANELFLTAVHELGHLLGLPHSSNGSSVMYFLALDGPVFLDSADLAALAARHRLRAGAGIEAKSSSGPIKGGDGCGPEGSPRGACRHTADIPVSPPR